ncbi:hypothetical protein DRO02_02160 [archaeon]|nr:MAG: hypothetical protein DRO21_03465 [archaeon]RLG65360.1 MAG: hypothetical protein DRO02_02160 [archaeon]RLG65978.1 MAG: hypothetical protein DRN89_01710 [archaeon]
MMKPRKVTVNLNQCKAVARVIKGVRVKEPLYGEKFEGIAPDFYLVFSAICYDTRGFRIPGTNLHGSHAIFEALMREYHKDPRKISIEYIHRNLTLDEFRKWMQCVENISRVEERYVILKETAKSLIENIGGIDKLLSMDTGEIIKAMNKLKAFTDPLKKKIMVFLKFIHESGMYKVDLSKVIVALDYHLTRIAFRTGMISLNDETLLDRIRNGKKVRIYEDLMIRKAAIEAYTIVGNESGLDAFTVDTIFWNLGRSCCRLEYASCHTCRNERYCTFTKATFYKCEGKCPLSTVCKGAVSKEYRSLKEHFIKTFFY